MVWKWTGAAPFILMAGLYNLTRVKEEVRLAVAEQREEFGPQNPHYASFVEESFAQQAFMRLMGAQLLKVVPGEVEILLPFNKDLTQQHGFLHAGVVTTIVDNACGYAALSLMPAGASVLTVEFKVNFLAPAKGERFIAKGSVIKPGKTITVCVGEVLAINGEVPKLIATISATMMMLLGRPGVVPG